MSANLIAAADGQDSLFATLDADGSVSVWSGPGEMHSQFTVELAQTPVPVPSRRLAMVAGETGTAVVVGSWTQGVAAFGLDGQPLWHRRDIRHVQSLRTIPDAVGERRILTVIQERGGGLILGQSGGTRYRISKARFLDGWPDAALLVFDGKQISRRTPPYSKNSWSIDLSTFAVLDTVVGDGSLVCSADGFLRLIGNDGETIWRVSTGKGQRVVRARSDPDSSGWVCLAATNEPGSSPKVLKITPEGTVAASADFNGEWIDFVLDGQCIVTTNGDVFNVANLEWNIS